MSSRGDNARLVLGSPGRHETGPYGVVVIDPGARAFNPYIPNRSRDVNSSERTAVAHVIGELPFERSFRCTGK